LLGIGQFVSSIGILRYNHKIRQKGLWFIGGLCWGGFVQIVLGQSNSIAMMAALLFAWGIGGGFYMNLSQTLIQNNTLSCRDGSSDGRSFSFDVWSSTARRTLRWPNSATNRFGATYFFDRRRFDAAHCNLFLDYKEESARNGLVFRS